MSENIIKYGNRIAINSLERIEFLDQRFYKVNEDIFLPSVTTILEAYPKGAQFYEWLKANGKEADTIRDEAGAVGSNVHAATEEYDKGFIVEWDDKQYSLVEWQLLCRYAEFSSVSNYTLVCNELSIAIPELGYGGTIDRIMNIEGKRYLIDIKTSNAVYDQYWLQLLAYKNLWEFQNPDYPIEHIAILHLKSSTRTDKSGKGEYQGKGWKLCYPEKSIEHLQKIFDATFLLWREENPNAKPKNLVYPNKLQRT